MSPTNTTTKRYSVCGVITIRVRTEVEASSADEARTIALNERAMMSLCHSCAGADASEQWVTSGELDCDTPSPPSGESELEVIELD